MQRLCYQNTDVRGHKMAQSFWLVGYFMHASGRQYNGVFKVIEGELFWSGLRVEFALFLSKPRKVH